MNANAAIRADPARTRELILAHGWNATSYQILNPGIQHWFSNQGDAVIGFVVQVRTRVVAGAPVCSAERLAAVTAEFEASASAAGQHICYFGAESRLENLLVPTGRWSVASLGAQPSWDPAQWPGIVSARASLRAQLNRARNKQVRVTEWMGGRGATDPGLRRCLTEWLADRRMPALHFLVEPETLGQLEDRRLFVAERDDAVVGFLIASPIPARRGWLVEQIIRGQGAPNGTAELLLDAAMRALAEGGAKYVTLGLSPLSRHSRFDSHRMPSWLRLVLRWVRAHGRRFYNFEGLDQFKSKFAPDAWEEVVALSDSRHFSPRALWAVAAAFAQGSPLMLVVRATARAAGQEIGWLRKRASGHRKAGPA
jgi:phosphatidylglycerol lysyltransferase